MTKQELKTILQKAVMNIIKCNNMEFSIYIEGAFIGMEYFDGGIDVNLYWKTDFYNCPMDIISNAPTAYIKDSDLTEIENILDSFIFDTFCFLLENEITYNIEYQTMHTDALEDIHDVFFSQYDNSDYQVYFKKGLYYTSKETRITEDILYYDDFETQITGNLFDIYNSFADDEKNEINNQFCLKVDKNSLWSYAYYPGYYYLDYKR